MDFLKMMRTPEGLTELEQSYMDLDSTFRFKCRKCGKCCKNQHSILFSPLDIFKIAQKVGKSPSAVVKDYTEVYIGPQSRIPLVHLLMRGPKNACPFLAEDGRCSIHDAKPTVCALYPLGRIVTSKHSGEALSSGSENIVHYIMSAQCGSLKKVHTVREWLNSFGIPADDEFFYLWTGVQIALGDVIRTLEEKNVSTNLLQPLWNVMYAKFYIDYDTKQEFFPQFERNAGKLLHDMPELQKHLEAILDGA